METKLSTVDHFYAKKTGMNLLLQLACCVVGRLEILVILQGAVEMP